MRRTRKAKPRIEPSRAPSCSGCEEKEEDEDEVGAGVTWSVVGVSMGLRLATILIRKFEHSSPRMMRATAVKKRRDIV